MGDVWSEFETDPRDPSYAALRASDVDRDVAQRVLGEAYAAGRLTREELDERSDRALAARTLGDLPPLLADLAPATSLTKRPAPDAPATDFRAQATEKWRRERREAVWGALTASLICVVIWAATGGIGPDMAFPWPIFVILGTGLNVGRVLFMRQSFIDERTRQLERRHERALERRERRDQREPDA